ncbi:hypothetical protein NDU88_000862 [Pleurodeles waltl]|uniref:Uncharacterized protein n=1 Tax=Pleurodeles waltl TaxID=8319 RepID=A0AAV7MJU3_PLEWA|nr:hypothetical protein NDU88_000862 [Pleurodeles waltl]
MTTPQLRFANHTPGCKDINVIVVKNANINNNDDRHHVDIHVVEDTVEGKLNDPIIDYGEAENLINKTVDGYTIIDKDPRVDGETTSIAYNY